MYVRPPSCLRSPLPSKKVCPLIVLAKQIAVTYSSKLDYCNSLSQNIPEKDIGRLPHVQNCLARVVTKAPRFSRFVPIYARGITLASCQISFSFQNMDYL